MPIKSETLEVFESDSPPNCSLIIHSLVLNLFQMLLGYCLLFVKPLVGTAVGFLQREISTFRHSVSEDLSFKFSRFFAILILYFNIEKFLNLLSYV